MSLELIRLTSFYSDDLISGVKLLQDKIQKDITELEYYLTVYKKINKKLVVPFENSFDNFLKSTLLVERTNSRVRHGRSGSNDASGQNHVASGGNKGLMMKEMVTGIRKRIMSNPVISGGGANSSGGDVCGVDNDFDGKELLYDNGEIPIGVRMNELKLNELRSVYQEFMAKFNDLLPFHDLEKEQEETDSKERSVRIGEVDYDDPLVSYNELVDDLALLRNEKIGLVLMDYYKGVVESGKLVNDAWNEYKVANSVSSLSTAGFSNKETSLNSDLEQVLQKCVYPIVLNSKMIIEDDFELREFIGYLFNLENNDTVLLPNDREHSIDTSPMKDHHGSNGGVLGKKILDALVEMFDDSNNGGFRPVLNIMEIEQTFHFLTNKLRILELMVPREEDCQGYQSSKYYKVTDQSKEFMGFNSNEGIFRTRGNEYQEKVTHVLKNYDYFIEMYTKFVTKLHSCMIEYNDIFMRKLMKLDELFNSKTLNKNIKIDYVKEMESLYVTNTTAMMMNIGNFQYFGNHFMKLGITTLSDSHLNGVDSMDFNYKQELIEPVLNILNKSLQNNTITGESVLEQWVTNDITEIIDILHLKKNIVHEIIIKSSNASENNSFQQESFHEKILKITSKNTTTTTTTTTPSIKIMVGIIKNFLLEVELIKYIEGVHTIDFHKIIQYIKKDHLKILQLLIQHFDHIFNNMGYQRVNYDSILSISTDVNTHVNTTHTNKNNVILFSQLFFQNNKFQNISNLNLLIKDILFENRYYSLISERIAHLEISPSISKSPDSKSPDSKSSDSTTNNPSPLLVIKKRTTTKKKLEKENFMNETDTTKFEPKNNNSFVARNSRIFLNAIQRKFSDSVLQDNSSTIIAQKDESVSSQHPHQHPDPDPHHHHHHHSFSSTYSSKRHFSLGATSHPLPLPPPSPSPSTTNTNTNTNTDSTTTTISDTPPLTEREFVPKSYKRLSSLPTFPSTYTSSSTSSPSTPPSSSALNSNYCSSSSSSTPSNTNNNNRRLSGINLLKK